MSKGKHPLQQMVGLLCLASATLTTTVGHAAEDPSQDHFRRVVTTVDKEGHSIITSNGRPPLVIHPNHPQQVLTDLLTIGQLPADFSEPIDHESFQFNATGQGVRIFRNKLPPDSVRYADKENKTPFMHRTSTIDFIQVLEGELWLVMENGEEVQLHSGDCVVQRGAVHAWSNRSEEPVTFLAVMIAADDKTLLASPVGDQLSGQD